MGVDLYYAAKDISIAELRIELKKMTTERNEALRVVDGVKEMIKKAMSDPCFDSLSDGAVVLRRLDVYLKEVSAEPPGPLKGDTCPAPNTRADGLQAANRDLRAALAEARREIRETGKRRDWYAAESTEAKGQVATLRAALAESREECERLLGEIGQLQDDLADARDESGMAKRDRDSTEKDVDPETGQIKY